MRWDALDRCSIENDAQQRMMNLGRRPERRNKYKGGEKEEVSEGGVYGFLFRSGMCKGTVTNCDVVLFS